MTRIIAIGGKKKSGKGLAGTYLSGLILSSRNSIKDFRLDPKNSDHCINTIAGSRGSNNIHINDIDPSIVKIYGFADKLKEICASMFNIDIKLLYGNEEQKNSLTDIKWKDVPGVVTDKEFYDKLLAWEKRNHRKLGRNKFGQLPTSITYRPNENITVRELLQYFGTDICRRIFNSCWVNSLDYQIKQDKPEFAIITDMRFNNEFHYVNTSYLNKSVTVLLLRDINNNLDSHISENSFDKDLPWKIVIDNRAGTPQDMCAALISRIKETNILRPV